MTRELLIFIGHSSDATKEVEAIYSLEGEFQKFLRRHVKNLDCTTSSIKMFIWENDANLGIGGQKFAINPYLENADIALFIFKERIGKVTWEELQYCKENQVRTIAIFPASPPYPERLNEEIYVDQWMDLIKKKKSLTEDWSSENSSSITPVDPYVDIEDLKGIVRERISDLIPDIIFNKQQGDSKNIGDSISTKIQMFGVDLNDVSGTLEYSKEILTKYRLKLRNEYKSIYPESLSDLVFLRKMGFVKNDKLTLAGVLLFNEQPTKHLRSALTRVSKYEGKNKSSSKIRMDIDDSIINQILLSREFIENHIDYRDSISIDSTDSQRIFKYPMKCIREVLANALCHRDYSDNSRFVYITIYNDRIEISNPGEWGNRTLNEGEVLSFNDILGRPVEKNLSLARAISAINFMEMEGSGIETSISNCIDEGAPIPEVIFENGYITVKILPRKNWEIFNPQTEISLIESTKIIILDKIATEGSIKSHLNFVKNWANEISFRDLSQRKSVRETTVEISLWVTPSRFRLLEDKEVSINLETLLLQQQNCIILGNPGAGKTTAIKILVNKVLESKKINLNFDFPLVILLRNLHTNTYSNFYNLLAREIGMVFKIDDKELNLASKSELSQSYKMQLKADILNYLEEKRTLIFLDGLDEIADYELRQSLLRDLNDLSYDLKKSKIVLTSRTGEFNYQLDKFVIYEIAPLSNSQVAELSQKWLGEDSIKFLREVKKSGFYSTMKSPLLIAHLLAIFDRIGTLPSKPKTLYKKIVYLMLEEWDNQRSIKRNSRYSNFDTDRKFDFLSAVSYNLTCTFRKVTFSRKDIELVITSLADAYKLPKQETTQVIGELESMTGIFVQTGFDSFEFRYKSIQEFLCAEHMVTRPNSWNLNYLNLPNELAIAVSISSNPNFYFINIVRHLNSEPDLSSEFILQYVNRLKVEIPDFVKSKELSISFYLLLTKLVILNKTDFENIRQIANYILSISSDSIELEIKEMYNITNFENLSAIIDSEQIESINMPKNYKYYCMIQSFAGPEILENWPIFLIMNGS